MSLPASFRYTNDHEWISIDGDVATVGITDHAQAELTDVVYVELPEMGAAFDQNDTVNVVESVKAASDTFAPVSGEIVEVNEALEADPSLINTDPFGAGWMYKLKMSSPDEASSLMDAAAYESFIQG